MRILWPSSSSIGLIFVFYFDFQDITSETEDLCEKPENENKDVIVQEDVRTTQPYPKVCISNIW